MVEDLGDLVEVAFVDVDIDNLVSVDIALVAFVDSPVDDIHEVDNY